MVLVRSLSAIVEKHAPLKTVLLADDLNVLREMLRDFLESMNIRVLATPNAAEGRAFEVGTDENTLWMRWLRQSVGNMQGKGNCYRSHEVGQSHRRSLRV